MFVPPIVDLVVTVTY